MNEAMNMRNLMNILTEGVSAVPGLGAQNPMAATVDEAREPNYHSVFAMADDGTWTHQFDADNKEDARLEKESLKNQGTKAISIVIPQSQMPNWNEVSVDDFVKKHIASKAKPVQAQAVPMEESEGTPVDPTTAKMGDPVFPRWEIQDGQAEPFKIRSIIDNETVMVVDDHGNTGEMKFADLVSPDLPALPSVEEGLENGYHDVHVADGQDFFPDGADSPVVAATGPSGARQGDNPEQKKMAVTEHKELVYNYRKFLKEATLTELSKDTLKSYAKKRGDEVQFDQRDAKNAYTKSGEKGAHGDAKGAAEWDDEGMYLDKRAEKGANNVAKAVIKAAQKK